MNMSRGNRNSPTQGNKGESKPHGNPGAVHPTEPLAEDRAGKNLTRYGPFNLRGSKRETCFKEKKRESKQKNNGGKEREMGTGGSKATERTDLTRLKKGALRKRLRG